LAPGAALIVSLATFVFTQRRANQLEERAAHVEERAAAKDTVELLAKQNEALREELLELRSRIVGPEAMRDLCEKERAMLLAEILKLRPKE